VPLSAAWIDVRPPAADETHLSEITAIAHIPNKKRAIAKGVGDAVDHAREHLEASRVFLFSKHTLPDPHLPACMYWLRDAPSAAPAFVAARKQLEELKVWTQCMEYGKEGVEETARHLRSVLETHDVAMSPALLCEPWSSEIAMPLVEWPESPVMWPDTSWNPFLLMGNLGRVVSRETLSRELAADLLEVASAVVPCGPSPVTGMPAAMSIMAMTRPGEPQYSATSRVLRACIAVQKSCGVPALPFCPDLWFEGSMLPPVRGLWFSGVRGCILAP
jgi:hypothetical protein